MDVYSSATSNWLFDYEVVDFTTPTAASAFNWSTQAAFTNSCDVGAEIDCSFGDLDSLQEASCRKRLRSETCTLSGTKACREKLRRDKLNERFLELSSILDPGKPSKTEKTAILNDAIRMVMQLRSQQLKLEELNKDLLEKIEELKAEKKELRDEKRRLKADKEKLVQQIRAVSAQPGFPTQTTAFSAAFAAQGRTSGNKLMPFIGYPGVAMWQFLPPAVADTSQDHVLRPPVA